MEQTLLMANLNLSFVPVSYVVILNHHDSVSDRLINNSDGRKKNLMGEWKLRIKKTGRKKRAQSKQRIENLEKKIKRLRARKAAEETKLKRQAKKEDTRRKILIGAYYLNEAEKNDTVAELYRWMDF